MTMDRNRTSLYLDESIKRLARLPGIGVKSASRLAFHVLTMSHEDVRGLAASLVNLKENIRTCSSCGGISDGDLCSVCGDESRQRDVICVVEMPKDMITIDSTDEYTGLFHVLNGLISPLDGVGPEDLNITPLIERCKMDGVREVIIALNPTVEGDATTLYLSKLLHPLSIKVTRIAHGLPVGSDLEFADSATIIKSIEGRVEIR